MWVYTWIYIMNWVHTEMTAYITSCLWLHIFTSTTFPDFLMEVINHTWHNELLMSFDLKINDDDITIHRWWKNNSQRWHLVSQYATWTNNFLKLLTDWSALWIHFLPWTKLIFLCLCFCHYWFEIKFNSFRVMYWLYISPDVHKNSQISLHPIRSSVYI